MRFDRESKMGLLSEKTEALLALGLAATVGCDSCISDHVEEALAKGATDSEVRQTIEIARHFGGSPALECCDEALESLEATA